MLIAIVFGFVLSVATAVILAITSGSKKPRSKRV